MVQGVVVAGGVLVLALAGCSQEPGTVPFPVASSSVVVPSGIPSMPGTAAATHDDGRDAAPLGPALVLDDAARAGAVSTATKAMGLFVRRDVPAETWWKGLVPVMTDQAQQAYRYTDPRNVPVKAITGPATLTPASKPSVARVSIPTDVGSYLLILARTEEDPTWRVDRVLPPENIGEP